MPKPPEFDFFTDMKFITNYILAGCDPPFDLLVEFSQEPAEDLLMLFLMPDLVDIGQAIFEPKGGRRRKPARHGRKRRRGKGMPDPSDMIGQRIRAVVNPHDVVTFGPLVKAFRIWNVYELFNITVAVIDGISDIGFESLWGILNADPSHCNNLNRLAAHEESQFSIGGVGPYFQPIGLTQLDFNKGFARTSYSCRLDTGNVKINLAATIRNERNDIRFKGCLALRNRSTGEHAESGRVDLGPNENARLEVNMFAEDPTWIDWGMTALDGFCDVYGAAVLAYDRHGIPFPI